MSAREAIGESFGLFSLASRMPSAKWAEENMITDVGRRFSARKYPHLVAPNGPFSAVDDPRFTTIWLMFGSQLGKTFFGQTVQAYFAHQAPCPMLFASADEKLSQEGVGRFYDSLARMESFRELLPPPHRRKRKLMDLRHCKIYVAWPRSVSTLADKAIKCAHGAEFDKWNQPLTSREAHPAKLFTDRGKSFQHTKKWIIEGTPTIAGQSRIEAGFQLSDRRKFYVPCPHCHQYQILVFGDGKTLFGVKWARDEHGKHHHTLANETACYECAHCHQRIENYHRFGMMNKGIWCPEGCQVAQDHARAWFAGECDKDASEDPKLSKAGWKLLEGTPVERGHDAGFHLSTLYSLTCHWGDIAEEWVKGMEDREAKRNFINQWLGLTWEKTAREQTWEQLGTRIISKDDKHGVVPDWAALVTAGVDKQADHLIYVTKAWGPERRNHTIDYGGLTSFDELVKQIIQHSWPGKDGKTAYRTILTFVDAGFLPDQVHEFCAAMRANGFWVMPCRGTDRLMNSPVQIDRIKAGPRAGSQLAFIESYSTQAWMDRALYEKNQNDEGCMTIYGASLSLHREYLQQLLNETSTTQPGMTRRRERWDKVLDNVPNDYRDAERMAFAAAYVATYGGTIRPGQKFDDGPLQPQAKGPRIIGRLSGSRS